MGWWHNIWTEKAKEWAYIQLSSDQTPLASKRKTIKPSEHYLNIFLRYMRVVNVRKGLTKFYGAVHSYISLPHLSGIGEFQTVVAPTALRNIDVSNLGNVIPMNHRLLGPVPYRGGDLEIEIGLFSVKSSDLTEPFLTMLEELSSVAGVSLFPTAQPFVQPLLKGIKLLMTTQGENTLEIGLTRTFDKLETGEILVIRAPKDSSDLSLIALDTDFRLVKKSGRPIDDYPYLVLGIETTNERDDWFSIPELNEAYNLLMQQIRKDKIDAVKEAWETFKRIAQTSPDLLSADAEKLVEKKVKPIVDRVLAPTATAAARTNLPAFAELNLYDH
jgi:hypothetical protein